MVKFIPGRDFDPSTALGSKLLRELLDANRAYARTLGEHLSINETDLRAMELLMEHGPMTIGKIAKALEITPGAATQAIDRLVAVGHANRVPSETDRRSVLVHPNPESVKTAWTEISPLIRKSMELLEQMQPNERVAVVNFLQEMTKAYSERNPKTPE